MRGTGQVSQTHYEPTTSRNGCGLTHNSSCIQKMFGVGMNWGVNNR